MKLSLAIFAFCSFSSFGVLAQQEPEIFAQLDAIDSARSGAPVLKTSEAAENGIRICSDANIATEFDNADSRLSRVSKTPCTFAGITIFTGRGDPLAGDILKYDPDNQTINWDVSLRDNVRFGQMALAYDVVSAMGFGEKKSNLTKEQKDEVKAMTATSFLILPLYGAKDVLKTYEATNGFGAKTTVVSLTGERYSLAINLGKQMMAGPPFRIASVPLPRDIAPDLVPNFDLKLYWITARPCGDCLTGGQTVTGNLGGATFRDPREIHLTQHYVFAKLVAVRFIDRRNGKTYAISAGAQSFFNH